MRHFIKASAQIYSIDETGNLITLNVSEVPSRSEFYQYGVEDLASIFTPSNKTYLSMDRANEMNGGMTYTSKITPQNFSRQIKRIRNYNKGVV